MKLPSCSIVITAYNAADDLPPCLENLLSQGVDNCEIILVNNASTDNTAKIVEPYLERIRYVDLPKNRAIAGGYNAGAAVAQNEIVVFINADTKAHPGWLAGLLRPFVQDQTIGMTTSRIVLYDDLQRINTCGNEITWTGLTVCRGFGESASQWQNDDEVSAGSGASLAIRRSIFEEIGGFDEILEFYWDDTDLSLRTKLNGHRIWYAADSRIGHRYEFKFSASKAFYLERNRWLTMLKVLRWRTFVLLLPGLLLGEMMAWVYSALNGREHLQKKWQSWRWIWANWSTIREMRARTQAIRRVSDRDVLRLWSPNLSFTGTVKESTAKLLESILQPMLRGYGHICRLLAA